MLRSILLWAAALAITLAAAHYQRVTGPTYPVDGSATFGNGTITYSLTRTHGGKGDQDVPITAPDPQIRGTIVFRRVNSTDAWMRSTMSRSGDKLIGTIPHQAPAGKVEYYVELSTPTSTLRLPEDGSTVITRFKGDVPAAVLIPHIIAIFLAMLVSTRAGLEVFSAGARPRTYAFWTLGLLIIGGFIFGPIVQNYAFGAYWTGFPYGTDLTDNKTLIAFVGWVIATMFIWDIGGLHLHPKRRWAVLAAAVLLLVVFLIPHSLRGSELNYNSAGTPAEQTSTP